jgi:hypothetical protein
MKKKTDDKLKKENLQGFFTSEVLNDLFLGHIRSVLLNHILRHLPLPTTHPKPRIHQVPGLQAVEHLLLAAEDFVGHDLTALTHKEMLRDHTTNGGAQKIKPKVPSENGSNSKIPAHPMLDPASVFFSTRPKRKPGRCWMTPIKNQMNQQKKSH